MHGDILVSVLGKREDVKMPTGSLAVLYPSGCKKSANYLKNLRNYHLRPWEGYDCACVAGLIEAILAFPSIASGGQHTWEV